MASITIEKRIRWSGVLVIIGLLVQILSMSWSHPLAFMAFLIFGCPLTLSGVLLYLFSLTAKR